MGLVFDLAEAINIVWETASGEAAHSIRDLLSDRAFRSSLIREFERSAAVQTAPLALKVAKSKQFLRWMEGGAEAPLDQFLADDQLVALGVDSTSTAVQAGIAIRESVRRTAIQFASWPERQLLADTANLQASLGVVEELLTSHLLGLAPRAFATQGQYLSLLQRRQGGQSAGALSYIPPREDHPAHPANLWNDLSQGTGRALLIKGVGGSGKTRLLLEVAGHAHRTGWHVIHVLNRPPGTVEDLSAIVLASERPVLIVLDYPNDLEDFFDLTELRNQLIPDAAEAGVPLGLLAAARPGWLALSPPLGPFEIVGIDNSDEHQAHVSLSIARSIAPTATAQLGDAEFGRLVGARPMIATLIARELEQLAIGKKLTASTTTSIRSGHLSDWLQRRFSEDGYSSEMPRRLADTRLLSTALCVATAIATATPNDVDAALQCGSAVARAMGETDPERFARRTLDHLLRAGWITQSDDHLASIHDTVVDHLISNVVESDVYNGRSTYGAAVFTNTAVQLRAVPSLLSHLRRYATDPGGNDSVSRADCAKYLVDWADSAFPDIRVAVLETPDGELAASIRQLLHPLLRSEATTNLIGLCWREWLERYGASPTAARVVATLVSHNVLGQLPWVLTATREWLGRNGTTVQAKDVLVRLQLRSDLRHNAWVQSAVRAWVIEHATEADARALLTLLIQQHDLRSTVWAQAAVQDWLTEHGSRTDARNVLDSVISKSDLRNTTWARVAVQTWLTHHGDGTEARSVLESLVRQPDLHSTEWVLTAVKGWLSEHGDRDDSRGLLECLIEQPDLSDTEWVRTAVQDWLTEHGEGLEARSVLNRLVEQSDLRGTDWAQTAVQTWLGIHGVSTEARDLLGRLVEQPELCTVEWVQTAVQTWLTEHGSGTDARSVLDSLISRPDLRSTEWVQTAVQGWLTEHGRGVDARSVLHRLIEQPEFSGTEWIQDAVHSWLTDHGSRHDARLLLAALLHNAEARRSDWVRGAVQTWLGMHGDTVDASHLLLSLLYHPTLGKEDWVQDAAQKWLAKHGAMPTAPLIRTRARRAHQISEGPWGALLDWTAEES